MRARDFLMLSMLVLQCPGGAGCRKGGDVDALLSGAELRRSQASYVMGGSIVVSGDGAVELIVTNPLGERLGFDRTGALPFGFREISTASYEDFCAHNELVAGDCDGVKVLQVGDPAVGDYRLDVLSFSPGEYDLDFEFLSSSSLRQAVRVAGVSSGPGDVHGFTFSYGLLADTRVTVLGPIIDQ